MPSSVSTKDLAKAVGAALPTVTLPLPEDLAQLIEDYLEKHEKYEEGVADRLQEELLTIYQKQVQGDPTKYAPFLAILRMLRPVLRTHARILEWWEKLVEPVLDNLGHEKGLANEALANVLDIVKADDSGVDDDGMPAESRSVIPIRLLEKWMQVFETAQSGGDSLLVWRERRMRDTLILFGKKQPGLFLLTLSGFFVRREYRSRSLTLLSDFIQSRPPHLHLVLQTPLFENLLRCLRTDTSTTIITMAITCLAMLLPNMPSSLVPFLPTLFNIYARMLFWDRERASDSEQTEDEVPRSAAGSSSDWEKCSYSSDFDGISAPNVLSYFTILYGLYPINFTDYIRKPQRYLRHANMENPDDIEVQPSEIRYRSERFRQMHLLHSNFYSLTIESEKTDFGRWLKSEPAEVVAECMALCLSPDAGASTGIAPGLSKDLGSPPVEGEGEKEVPDAALLSSSVVLDTALSSDLSPTRWRQSLPFPPGSPASSRVQSGLGRHNSASSRLSRRPSSEIQQRESGGDSPTLPAQLPPSASQTHLQDLINSNKAIKSGLNQTLTNDSVPSLSLSHQESLPEKGSSKAFHQMQDEPASSVGARELDIRVAQLYRQILLLQNDLNFERYMKQQHMAHIGEIRRRQVREAATEAETQNLIMANRNLKQRLEEAKRAELQAKKESENRRTLAKKWEADLSAKLRTLREEQKKWNSEGASLKRELELARDECERLTRLVCEVEVKELNLKQNMQSIDINVGEMERLKAEVERLTAAERNFQAKEGKQEFARMEAAEADSRAEMLRIRLAACEAELRKTRDGYEEQLAALNTKFTEAQNQSRAQQSSEASAMFEKAVAANRAKHSELQKQYGLLMRKYTVLQSSLLNMTCATNQAKGRDDAGASVEADAHVSAIVGDPTGLSRPQRSLADPNAFGPASFRASTPPPPEGAEPVVGSAKTVVHMPSIPGDAEPGAAAESPAAGATSPQTERYYGRGGIQNLARKDSKTGKSSGQETIKKKPSGLRGIRGFM